MKMKPEYIRQLLIAVEKVNSPTPSLLAIIAEYNGCSLDQASTKIDDEFLLHYELLFDYGFIESMGNSNGIKRMYHGSTIINVDLRITAHGHEFLAAIEKDNVWSVIKDKFSEESLDTIFTISKQLATNFAKKKLEQYLD